MPTYAVLMERQLQKGERNKRIFPLHQIKFIDLLIKRRLIPEKYGTNKQENSKKDLDSNYNFLRQIRGNPKKVEIHDMEIDQVVIYPSIYKTASALDENTGVIGIYDGKVWRIRYAIKVLTESF